MGAHITALASSKDADYVRQLGTDMVLDYRITELRDLPAFDAILDTAGTSLLSLRRHLAPGGRMVTVNFGSEGAMCSIALSALFGPRRIRTFSANPLRRELQAITPYIEARTLRADVAEVFPLEEIAAAHMSLATKAARGKRVLTL